MTTISSFVNQKGIKNEAMSPLRTTNSVSEGDIDNSLRIDFLKIDAEGKDREVLEGAVEQLQRDIAVFTFECAPCALKEVELKQFDDMGFSCYSLTRAGDDTITVVKLTEILSII